MSKTNVIRILEAKRILHASIEYKFNEDELDAVSVANKIGVDDERVFKTLVAEGDKTGINIFCIPAKYELNLKKAATASGNKKVEMIKVKELLPITGYIRGGCSPIGMKKLYPIFIDESARLFDNIYVSAGIRGMQIKLNPEDLINLINGVYADLL
ncbi:MAG: Cys-tRNA(Pro) deacylase [bacterium]